MEAVVLAAPTGLLVSALVVGLWRAAVAADRFVNDGRRRLDRIARRRRRVRKLRKALPLLGRRST